jgi:hypothetical protein
MKVNGAGGKRKSADGKNVRRKPIMKAAPAGKADSANHFVNRRLLARYRFSTPISVHPSKGRAVPAITLEISESGLSAVLAAAVKVGGTVLLEPVAGGTVTAEVRHNIGKVYEFTFLKMTQEQTQKLRDECLRLPRYPPNKMGI